MEDRMRPALVILAATAAVIVTAAPSHAWYAQGPWCAGQSLGWTWVERCTLPSLEACRDEVIAGNRGICFPNPWYAASVPERGRKAKRKRR
jgi:hypothetical protein